MRPTLRWMPWLALAAAVFAAPRRGAADDEETAPAAKTRAEKPTRGLRFPSLTPDGETVVFAWRGDVWRAPVAGGPAARLTIHEAQDTKPRVSPDGKSIAFSSRRTGGYDVFVVGIDGGEPRQLTFHSGSDVATDWSPDGQRLLITSSRDPSLWGLDVWEIDLAGGPARRLTRDGGRDGAYAPDGRTIVYARGFHSMTEDDYEGSSNYDLYVTDVDGAVPRRLTHTPRNEVTPCVSADGATVWFLAEWKENANFWAVPLAGGEPRPVTSWTDDNARRASLSWDRKTMAFEKDGLLYRADLTATWPTAVPIPIVVKTDVRNSGMEERTVSDGAEHVSVSPDGTRLAVAVRGDLWILPATGGEGTRVTKGPASDDWPRFSPDGKRLLYHSDARGNEDVYVLDLATKESRPLTQHAAADAFPAWSPDGRQVVFTSDRTGNKDLWLVDLESGEERQLTRDPKDDDDATFSADGRWIAFDSARGGSQAIWIMPATGTEAQARRVTEGAGFFQVPSLSPDGRLVAYEEMDPTRGAGRGIWVSTVGGGPAVQVSRDGSAACWSPRGDWIYFSADRGGATEVYRVRAPQSLEVGERVPFLGRTLVDRRRELGDLFDEAWRRLKEGFYDEKMHGRDWKALREKYRPLAVDAESRDEFYNVVSQLLGELGASHLGISGPREDDDEPDPSRGPETGYLGLDLSAETEPDGGRRVVAVQPRGPADEAGLRLGDLVKGIAGKKVGKDTDVDRLLAGAADKEVPVAFVKGDGSGERTVRVRATSWRALRQLRYELWVEEGRKAVLAASQGTAGYIHLNQMDQPNLARFSALLTKLAQDKKVEGLVLDVRNNGGGNIHPALLDALGNKPYIAFDPRGGSRQIQPALYWGKPVVLLINERSFSDAEVFPYAFKQLRLGKVVGVPTAGGVIGTTDVTLSDGSRFRIPRVGWYGLDGRNLEGLGVMPDVVVEETTQDRLEGRDPQLVKAIEVLLEDIAQSRRREAEEKAAQSPPSKVPAQVPAAGPAPGPAPGPVPVAPPPEDVAPAPAEPARPQTPSPQTPSPLPSPGGEPKPVTPPSGE